MKTKTLASTTSSLHNKISVHSLDCFIGNSQKWIKPTNSPCFGYPQEINKKRARTQYSNKQKSSNLTQHRRPDPALTFSFINRVMTTIMFTDIVRSTQRAFEMGDLQWMNLLQTHHALVRKNLKANSGKELQTNGDGFLIHFPHPKQAIQCANNIQKDMQGIKLPIRIGIHTGEVLLVDQSTILGLTVHIASRVTAIAQANQIVATQKVKDDSHDANIPFNHLGFFKLKGLPDAWRLYSIDAHCI